MHTKSGVIKMKDKICDIHAHIVPAVDDGAIDVNMAIKMLRSAYNQGTRNIVCTSHSDYYMDRYAKNLEILRTWVIKENINITLYSGCEIYGNTYAVKDLVVCLDKKILPTINETKYVLIEFNPTTSADQIVVYIAKLHEYGYKTILAHTERYPSLFEDDRWIGLLNDIGCLFQINAYSLTNENNMRRRGFATKLLMEKHVSFIGSDAHRTTHRPYVIKDGVDYIYKNCDIDYANDICYRNAERLLNIK